MQRVMDEEKINRLTDAILVMQEQEAQKEEILVNIQTAELQKSKLTREQMTAWFEQFRHGAPANREFQKCLIDTFVNAVYVFDDKLVLTYNYQHGTQTISLEEIASALGSDLRRGSPPIQGTKEMHPAKRQFFEVSNGIIQYQYTVLHEMIDILRN